MTIPINSSGLKQSTYCVVGIFIPEMPEAIRKTQSGSDYMTAELED